MKDKKRMTTARQDLWQETAEKIRRAINQEADNHTTGIGYAQDLLTLANALAVLRSTTTR